MIPSFLQDSAMNTISEKETKSPLKQLYKRGVEALKKRGKENQKRKNSSVRPVPKDAEKWALSFNELVNSKYGQALFKAFLQREFCEENLEFWLAVEQFKKSSESKLQSKGEEIYKLFVAPDSPKEVNLSSVMKQSIGALISQPTRNMFDTAQKRIQGIMEADAYVRFLTSNLYLELVQPEKRQC